MKTEPIKTFDWYRIFFTNDIPIDYFFEISFRTGAMFLFLVIVLKFLSKRGVKQLSIFELAILIALGSATGDPMFYHQIPILYGFLVLTIVIILYRIIIYLAGKSRIMEKFLEGQPICLLLNGEILYKEFKQVGLPYDKFYAELRMRSVEHLGQVRKVYLETSGEFSIYLFESSEVKAGLPIFPELINRPITLILNDDQYACIYCGHVERHTMKSEPLCKVCRNKKWLPVSTSVRVTS